MNSFYNKVMVPKQAPWWENIYLISDSFTEFLEDLYDYDIDEQSNEIRRYQDGNHNKFGGKGNPEFPVDHGSKWQSDVKNYWKWRANNAK